MNKPHFEPNWGRCEDLSVDAGITPSPEMSDGLCLVCQQLDFELLTFEGNLSCDKEGADVYHFHVGTLKQISDKRASCPGCWLILSAIKYRGIPEEIYDRLDVQVGSDHFVHKEPIVGQATQSEGNNGYRTQTSRRHLIDVHVRTLNGGMIPVGTIVRMVSGYGQHPKETRDPDNGTSGNEPFQGGRAVPVEVDLSRLKEWISLCLRTHPRCHDQTWAISPPWTNMPSQPTSSTVTEPRIRLIDVREHMIISSTPSQEFLALSYVWGDSPGLLTRDSLPSFSLPGGLLTSLNLTIPQTISDAISLTRSIGQRYLWVDSLCIIQDDEQDKHNQLPLMATIYSSALLVLVVATEDGVEGIRAGANGGIPRLPFSIRSEQIDPPHHQSDQDSPASSKSRTQPRQQQRMETINNIPFITLLPDMKRQLKNTTWNERGWTFQEGHLARRSLVFTSHQVYFSCQSGGYREDLAVENEKSVVTQGIDKYGTGGSCRNTFYCRYVEDFCARSFKNEEDVMWAYAGVLRGFQGSTSTCAPTGKYEGEKDNDGLFPKGFIWALPYESLDVALLWDGGWGWQRPPCTFCRCLRPVRRRGTSCVIEVGSGVIESMRKVGAEKGSGEDIDESGQAVGDGPHDAMKVQEMKGIRFEIRYPSWSWLSTSETVFFREACGNGLFGQVKWHKPILLGTEESIPYMESILVKRPGAAPDLGVKEYRKLREWSAAWMGAMDFGFLRFTAQTAELVVSVKEERVHLAVNLVDNAQSELSPGFKREDAWVEAVVKSVDGNPIGELYVPRSFFGSRVERRGEFIFLSSAADSEQADEHCVRVPDARWAHIDVQHVVGCRHIMWHHLMLIEWRDNIAYRLAICRVGAKQWEGVVTTEKQIVLG